MIVANTQVTDCASRSSPAHINRKSLTPLARIDLPAGKPPEYGGAVHNAMIATLNAPKDDRFHVISEHTRYTLLINPTYREEGKLVLRQRRCPVRILICGPGTGHEESIVDLAAIDRNGNPRFKYVPWLGPITSANRAIFRPGSPGC